MEIIELSGTYFEIGKQWGKAFGKDIRSSMDAEIMGLSRFSDIEKEQLVAMASEQQHSPGQPLPDRKVQAV